MTWKEKWTCHNWIQVTWLWVHRTNHNIPSWFLADPSTRKLLQLNHMEIQKGQYVKAIKQEHSLHLATRWSKYTLFVHWQTTRKGVNTQRKQGQTRWRQRNVETVNRPTQTSGSEQRSACGWRFQVRCPRSTSLTSDPPYLFWRRWAHERHSFAHHLERQCSFNEPHCDGGKTTQTTWQHTLK